MSTQTPQRWITRREAFARYGLTRKQIERLVKTHCIELRVRRGKVVLNAGEIEKALSWKGRSTE